MEKATVYMSETELEVTRLFFKNLVSVTLSDYGLWMPEGLTREKEIELEIAMLDKVDSLIDHEDRIMRDELRIEYETETNPRREALMDELQKRSGKPAASEEWYLAKGDKSNVNIGDHLFVATDDSVWSLPSTVKVVGIVHPRLYGFSECTGGFVIVSYQHKAIIGHTSIATVGIDTVGCSWERR